MINLSEENIQLVMKSLNDTVERQKASYERYKRLQEKLSYLRSSSEELQSKIDEHQLNLSKIEVSKKILLQQIWDVLSDIGALTP